MAGGNCARRLQADETCTALEFVECTPGSAEPLIYNGKVLYFFQYIMQAMGSVIIVVRLCVGNYMVRKVLLRYSFEGGKHGQSAQDFCHKQDGRCVVATLYLISRLKYCTKRKKD